jgi:hypothetical protein
MKICEPLSSELSLLSQCMSFWIISIKSMYVLLIIFIESTYFILIIFFI